jgi:hypothetical protein
MAKVAKSIIIKSGKVTMYTSKIELEPRNRTACIATFHFPSNLLQLISMLYINDIHA